MYLHLVEKRQRKRKRQKTRTLFWRTRRTKEDSPSVVYAGERPPDRERERERYEGFLHVHAVPLWDSSSLVSPASRVFLLRLLSFSLDFFLFRRKELRETDRQSLGCSFRRERELRICSECLFFFFFIFLSTSILQRRCLYTWSPLCGDSTSPVARLQETLHGEHSNAFFFALFFARFPFFFPETSITDLISFYELPSSVIGNKKYKEIKASSQTVSKQKSTTAVFISLSRLCLVWFFPSVVHSPPQRHSPSIYPPTFLLLLLLSLAYLPVSDGDLALFLSVLLSFLTALT